MGREPAFRLPPSSLLASAEGFYHRIGVKPTRVVTTFRHNNMAPTTLGGKAERGSTLTLRRFAAAAKTSVGLNRSRIGPAEVIVCFWGPPLLA